MSYSCLVNVIRGINLPVGDLISAKADPYVVISWGGSQVKTSVKKKTLSPNWDETFTLTSSTLEDIQILCYDKDRFKRDDVLGRASICTSSLINSTWIPITVILTPSGGELQLKFRSSRLPKHAIPAVTAGGGSHYPAYAPTTTHAGSVYPPHSTTISPYPPPSSGHFVAPPSTTGYYPPYLPPPGTQYAPPMTHGYVTPPNYPPTTVGLPPTMSTYNFHPPSTNFGGIPPPMSFDVPPPSTTNIGGYPPYPY